MVRQVCQFVVEQASLGRWVFVSINISGHHFAHPNFLTNLETIFQQTKVNPHQLTLEVTENVFLEDFDAVIMKMRALKKKGVRFSIDDFGTGYSSLSYLKSLPVDEIKIDRSFIQILADDQENRILVKAIFELAETFGLEVVVEGVETEAQQQILNTLGHPIIQGYLYAKPIDYRRWIDEVLLEKSA